MAVSKIGVLGAGTMGGGIAQVAAQAGFDVVLCDIELSLVEKAVGRMEVFLNKSVEKGRLTTELKDKALNCITKTADVADFADADLVIEAISEDLELKKEAFARLDQVCKAETLLATNTSSMSVTAIAGVTKRPQQVAGMHFFNPPALMKLVEVIRGYETTDETMQVIFEVAKKMGKTTVEVKKDFPGFIVTRVNMAQVIEAVRLVEEGVASPEDIDTAMKLGLNWPMGPFELQDFMGVDVTYFILEYLQDEFKDMRWNPPQTLKALIKSGRFGRKNKSGWFDY